MTTLFTIAFLSISTVLYPSTAAVVSIDGPAAMVSTATGFEYVIDSDDFEVGDLVSLVMYDNDTPDDISDDKIMDYRYAGYTVNQ